MARTEDEYSSSSPVESVQLVVQLEVTAMWADSGWTVNLSNN